MKKEKSRLLEFVAKTFLIAVACNVIIDLTIVHYNTNTTLALLPDTFILFAGVSFIAYLVICFVIFLISKIFEKGKPEKTFWYSMYFGAVASGLGFFMLKDLFAKYYGWTDVFAVVAIFAFLVGLTSQYQLYIGYEDSNDLDAEQSSETIKTMNPEDGIFGL